MWLWIPWQYACLWVDPEGQGKGEEVFQRVWPGNAPDVVLHVAWSQAGPFFQGLWQLQIFLWKGVIRHHCTVHENEGSLKFMHERMTAYITKVLSQIIFLQSIGCKVVLISLHSLIYPYAFLSSRESKKVGDFTELWILPWECVRHKNVSIIWSGCSK